MVGSSMAMVSPRTLLRGSTARLSPWQLSRVGPVQRLTLSSYAAATATTTRWTALGRLPNQSSPLQAARFASTTSSTPSFGGEDEQDRRSRQPPRWFQRPVMLLLALMPVFTFTLGVWQIKRLRWKLDLIDELESKLKKEPLSLPKNIDLDMLLSNYTNRLFAIAGRFPSTHTPENTVFLGPRVREGEVGYHVVQPLERDAGGGQVLVDRGFVPKSKIVNVNGDPSTWRLMETAVNSSLVPRTHLMLLPRPKERNSFTPANDPAKHTWFFADVVQLFNYFSRGSKGPDEQEDSYTPSAGVAQGVKEMLGLEQSSRSVLPVYLEEIFEGTAADAGRYLENGLPIGRAATVELRNQHAVYAATWFSLSAATSVMFTILVRRGR